MTTHRLDPKGDYVEYVRRKPKKNGKRGGINPDPPAKKRKVNTKIPDQPAIGRTGLVNPKNFRSKLIKKEGVNTKYSINLYDVDLSNIKKLRIKQESLEKLKLFLLK